ncbi:MAG: stage II sporulation protein E [Spirochaetaceae bacterium]|nr:stage II sporulation protein E [Spirochaetaceae bacterium]|tara:strand:- start:7671 stop:10346 length:2676 start_codon:yes stop_codon:yes gene_type:complete
MLYFNEWGIATLVCTLYTLVLLLYLISLKEKQLYTRDMTLFFFGAVGLNVGYLWSALVIGPLGGDHRFITVGVVFIPLVYMIQFAHHFPENKKTRASRIAFWTSLTLGLALVVHFYFNALQTRPDFDFQGELFNYPQEMGAWVARGMILMILWFTVVLTYRSFKMERKERRAARQLVVAMLIPTLLPGIVNVLYNGGRISHSTFQQGYVLTSLLGYTAIVLVFINNTVERTSFMTKIVGISLVTLLLAIQALSAFSGQQTHRSYDRIHGLQAQSYVVTGQEPVSPVAYAKPLESLDQGKLVKRSERTDFMARHFRQMEPHSDDLYVAYHVPPAGENQGDVIEVGYRYQEYRQFIHDSMIGTAILTLALVLSVLILYPIFFSRSLVKPLHSLLDGVGQVEEGDFEVKIPVMVEDEIGYLSRAFNNMVKSILDARQKLQDYAENLELKVDERTKEVTEKMQQIHEMKVQQDGDYYLTYLIGRPLQTNRNKSDRINTEFYVEQKKKFVFKERSADLGGDICVTGNLRLGPQARRHTVFMNGDAMGKSMQGAGGAIVMGTAMNNILARSAGDDRVLNVSPEEWLTETYEELHNLFLAFDGLMMLSAVVGVIDEETGMMTYFNAEHPWTVLYRKGQATFIEQELMLRKLGSPSEFKFQVQRFQLEPGDVLFAGSDGRDDLDLSGGADVRTINEDETLFLKYVEEADGDLLAIVDRIHATGTVTDDLSLLRVGFQETGSGSKIGDIDSLLRMAREGQQGNDVSGALRKLDQLLEIDPDHGNALRLKGRILMMENRYQEAVQPLSQLAELEPDNSDAFFSLSVCYKHLRQHDMAIQTGERVASAQPGRIANLINLADSYRVTGNLDRARELAEKALDLEPENPSAKKLSDLIRSAAQA